jgi:hypothetical protein
MSRQEYATNVEGLIGTMVDRLSEVSALYCAELPPDAEQGDCYNAESSIENIRSFVNEQVAARQAFVDGLEALEPPSGLEEFHDTALNVMIGLADAEAALADVVARGDTFESLDALFQSPEGQRLADAEGEAIALCEAAQADFDTAEEARLAGTVWIPPEMKQIVTVAFRCAG